MSTEVFQPQPAVSERRVTYWIATVLLATECLVGGAMGAARWPAFRATMERLGYPGYFMTILGVWYSLAGFALLAPRFPRLKEWAYAGLFFNYSGAIVSHLVERDGVGMLVGPIVFIGLLAISWALRPPDRLLATAPAGEPSVTRARTLAYWTTTAFVAFEFALGGVWDILRIPHVDAVMTRLGYPGYFTVLLGIWKLAAVAALLTPRFPRIKEWAYAGAIFSTTGAIASHLAARDVGVEVLYLTLVTALVFASWVLRPPTLTEVARRTGSEARGDGPTALETRTR